MSKRKINTYVNSFHSHEKDLEKRAWQLYRNAVERKMPGLEKEDLGVTAWKINSGRLLKQAGKNSDSATIFFRLSPKLGGGRLWSYWPIDWQLITKGFVLVRYFRGNQSLSNQRTFIAAIGYIKHAANSLGQEKVASITPEALELACRNISRDYAETTAYNLHKAVNEFAGMCDADRLCHCRFEFRYDGMARPALTNVVGHVRLDDVAAAAPTRGGTLEIGVYKLIGELFRNVPRDHKYRTYVLILTLLCCLGRRFSEIVTLPHHPIQKDENGNSYLIYFPRKQAAGDARGYYRKLYLPTPVVAVVEAAYIELAASSSPARSTAEESFRTRDVDIRFLHEIDADQPLFRNDLIHLGIAAGILLPDNEFYKDGFVHDGPSKKTAWTTKDELLHYFRKSFFLTGNVEPIHIDQFGRNYFLKDMLIVRYRGLSGGAYSRWSATLCTHSMMRSFLADQLPNLAAKFASVAVSLDFVSHQFRHTLNTLLDEGGLSDLLQTEWFGRTNARDTKAYQHTSREKKALMLRQDILDNKVGGKIVDVLKYVPITVKEAFLTARISAVHDVGPGMCIHNFVQLPCERHLQCAAECDDYVWKKADEGRIEEVKRQYSLTYATRMKAEELSLGPRPKRSIDWIAHSDKKLRTLAQQLEDGGISAFDPEDYLKKNGFNKDS